MLLFSTKLSFILATLTVLHSTNFVFAQKSTVLCYMVAWASTRMDDGNFTVSDADTQHCTHVVYAFMGLDNNTNTIMSIDNKLDLVINGTGNGQLQQLKDFKESNPNIKVLASIGGYLQGSVRFSEMARSSTKRADFIDSIAKFIRTWNLDGIDICWQHPGDRGGRADDRINYITLLRGLKDVFETEGWTITVHILAKRYLIDLGYDVKSISEVADFINLAAVEYHGPWDRTTGIMAPLNSKNENNVQYMINYVLKRGAIPSKVLLGLPTYGHAYLLSNEIEDGKYLDLLSDAAFPSPWTNEKGIIAYNEMCNNINTDKDWILKWDNASKTPVAYKKDRFVSYDNATSLIEKAKLVKSLKLGGIMLWSLDMDDFRGLCHGKKYPLLSAVTQFLDENETSIDRTATLNEPSTTPKPLDEVTPKATKSEAANQTYSNYKFFSGILILLHPFSVYEKFCKFFYINYQ